VNPKQWQQISRIYHNALACKDSQRMAYLEGECSGDVELLREVSKLLESHHKAKGFLDSPAIAVAAQALAAGKELTPVKAKAARVILTITEGPRKGKTLVFAEHKVCVFGRANECFEIMPEEDPTVGRHHFVLEINPPKVGIRDLGSLNGTYVNGRKLAGKQPNDMHRQEDRQGFNVISLDDGDTVKTGDTAFAVGLELPVPCSSCGCSLDLYCRASKSLLRNCAVFCERCRQNLRMESEGQVTRIAVKPSIRIHCSVCKKDLTAESDSWRQGEYVCPSCQEKMLKKKSLLQEVLNTTSQSGRREGIPSIRNYEIRKSLGKGRLGTVYLAKGKGEKRQVAVKVIFSTAVSNTVVPELFNSRLQEIRALRHPNLIELIDHGSASGSFYLVTEYCEFGNISRLLARRHGKLGLPEALPLMQQALEGLACIHHKGFSHGDLKPQNLLLAGQEGAWVVRISDFGLLGCLQELGLGGTLASEDPVALAFTPRELLTGSGSPGPAADVWSIAAVFYHMLTGTIPHKRKIESDPLASLIEPVILPAGERNADLLPEIAQLLDDCLKLDPRQRPRNAQEMLDRLRKIQVRVVRLTLAT
jgi:hypothetical protein